MITSKSSPIIFVFTGKKVPPYGTYSINFAKKNNPTRCIYLITDDIEYKNVNCTIFNITVRIHKEAGFYQQKKVYFRNVTFQRFAHILDFIKQKQFYSFFHAELDNLIFNLDSIDSSLDKTGEGLFIPSDTKERHIPSLMYCNNWNTLERFILTSIYLIEKGKYEMECFSIYKESNSDLYSLPTIHKKLSNYTLDHCLDISDNYIFDGAAIGQYIFGNDPQGFLQKTQTLFSNEKIDYDISSVKYLMEHDKNELYVVALDKQTRVLNLHIHSKIHEYLNEQKIDTFLQLANRNIKKTLIIKFLNKCLYLSNLLVR